MIIIYFYFGPPVFPWIITDLDSATLDLSAPETFRDFTKPIGALNAERLAKLKYKATEMEQMSPDPFFLYGSHYSNIGTVLFFLLRLEPFTSCAIDMQGGHFDHSDRLFADFSSAWQNCMINDSDLKEMVSEFKLLFISCYGITEYFANLMLLLNDYYLQGP